MYAVRGADYTIANDINIVPILIKCKDLKINSTIQTWVELHLKRWKVLKKYVHNICGIMNIYTKSSAV